MGWRESRQEATRSRVSSSHWAPELGFFFFASKMVRSVAVEEALLRGGHDWYHSLGFGGHF